MPEFTEKRSPDFLERLSILLVKGALIGGFIVLFDFKFTFTLWGQVVNIGSGFAAETKGMVLQSMLISGFAAVVAFWLGTTKQGQEQAQSVSRIAEAAPVSTAAAVAADVAAKAAAAKAVDSPADQPLPLVQVPPPEKKE
jgi:hypothetical protein